MRGSRLKPGQWGTVTFRQLPSGRQQADVYFRSQAGKLTRVRASGPTKAAARVALEQKIRPTTQKIETVGDLLTVWLTQPHGWSPATKERYSKVAKNHLLPELGDLRLEEFTTFGAQTALNKLASRISRAAAENARGRLQQACAWAVRMNLLPTDPAASTIVPGKAKRSRPRAPEESAVDRLRRLLEADLKSDRSGPKPLNPWLAFEIMAGTACRIGEACALDAEDIDYELGKLTFRSTVTGTHTAVETKQGLKNQDPYRISHMPARLARILEEHAPKAGPVLVTRKGTRVAPTAIRRAWRRVQAKAEIPEKEWVTPHDLRRRGATVLARALGVEEAARQLGDTLAVAEKHYVQPTYAGPERAADFL